MTASLPAARSVDHVSMEALFSHPRRAYPRRGDRPFCFSGGLNENGTGSVSGIDRDQRA